MTPVNDEETLSALLLGEIECIRPGREDQAQHTEFLRSRRLAGMSGKQMAGSTRGHSYG